MQDKVDKSVRMLYINEKLNRGERIKKQELKKRFNIPEKTFHRDIKALRDYYDETGDEITYDKNSKSYGLESSASRLTKQEIYAICKILIESRAFNTIEFNVIIEKLLNQCDTQEVQKVKKLIGNQKLNYLQLQHGKPLVNELWEISTFVVNQIVISFDYERQDKKTNKHCVKPVGIVFSEFYFYLLAYMVNKDDQYPTIYRVDRISNIKASGENFSVPYSHRFSESEFFKRIQFMYAGELKHVRFLYTGVPEALLDRLPTAKIEQKTPEGLLVRAEVFGNGIEMWLKSQGDRVKIIEEEEKNNNGRK